LAPTHSAGFELFDEKFENHLAPTHSAGFRIIGLKMQVNYFGVFSLLGIVNFILHHDLKNAFQLIILPSRAPRLLVFDKRGRACFQIRIGY